MAARLGRRRVLVVGLATLGLLGAFVGGAFATHIFSDVPTGAYYHDDVSWLVARGITSGCGGGKYCPNDAVTRGQMAVFLHKMANRTRTGHFSCDATGWHPYQSGTTYFSGVDHLVSDNAMDCNVTVPDAATITKVTWTLYDGDVTNNEDCSFYRRHLTSSLGTVDLMAAGSTSSNSGNQIVSDLTVANGLVDNDNYSYYSYCLPGAGSGSVGIFGMSVEYTYLGVPAP